jgi:hypothetical protein
MIALQGTSASHQKLGFAASTPSTASQACRVTTYGEATCAPAVTRGVTRRYLGGQLLSASSGSTGKGSTTGENGNQPAGSLAVKLNVNADSAKLGRDTAARRTTRFELTTTRTSKAFVLPRVASSYFSGRARYFGAAWPPSFDALFHRCAPAILRMPLGSDRWCPGHQSAIGAASRTELI